MEFIVKHFKELSTEELYEILKTRFEIYVTEQKCIYQDLDDKDQSAVHVFCRNKEGRVVGCLRIFWKDKQNGVAQIGRVATLVHGIGVGGKLLREGVRVARRFFDARKIYLEAQIYAIGYYEKEGFEVVSDGFMEDGIPHVAMELKLKTEDGMPIIALNEISEDKLRECRIKKDKEIADRSKKTKLEDLQVSELYSKHMVKEPEVLKLHLELNTEHVDDEGMEILRKYGKVDKGISRDILVPADITLHALSYAILRSFGWQNGHLHHFQFPAAVFQEMTGGKEAPDDDVYAKYDGLFTEWVKLCGLYFRFPNEEFDDIYWDDDYKNGQNFKSWMRKKYTGPYDYHGKWELYHYAHPVAKSVLKENPVIRATPSFAEWKASGKEKPESRMVPIEEATINDMRWGFDSGLDELIEKHPLIDLLIPERVKRDDNALSRLEFLCRMQEKEPQEQAVIPMAHYLNYLYDYGDGWEVKITMTDCYYTKTRWDVVRENHLHGAFVLKVNNKATLADTTAYDMNNQPLDEEYAKKVAKVYYNKKPVCVALDGLNLVDDVGGVGGYIRFLRNIKQGSPEEKKELREWATSMGWSGSMPKVESVL